MKNNFKLAEKLTDELIKNEYCLATFIKDQTLFSKEYKSILMYKEVICNVYIKASLFSNDSYIELVALGGTGRIYIKMKFNEYRKIDNEDTGFLKCFVENMMQEAKNGNIIIDQNATAGEWVADEEADEKADEKADEE